MPQGPMGRASARGRAEGASLDVAWQKGDRAGGRGSALGLNMRLGGTLPSLMPSWAPPTRAAKGAGA